MKTVFLLALLAVCCTGSSTAGNPSTNAGIEAPTDPLSPLMLLLLNEAGNTPDDEVRLLRLAQMRELGHSGQKLPDGLEALYVFAADWISPTRSLTFFNQAILEHKSYLIGVPRHSPLYPIEAFYQARMLAWSAMENSGIYAHPDRRKEFMDLVRGHLQVAAAAFPDNPVIGMYLGRPLPASSKYPAPPDAPPWAVAEREALERLLDTIEWWIRHRQRPDGSYGGGWGDDCEMWRDWVAILLAFDHPELAAAQSCLSRQLLQQPHLRGGYHNRLLDIEHSAEDLADALTPAMHLSPDEPEWNLRCDRLLELQETLWMGRNERGFLQFKSAFFTDTLVDDTPRRACDTVFHPKALQPLLLRWQRNRDERTGQIITAWMNTWVDAAARSARGKPPGMLPTALHWPDGEPGGISPDWWRPWLDDSPLYDYPSAQGILLKTLLLTWSLTGEERYLQPMFSLARIWREYPPARRSGHEPGSVGWCAGQLQALPEVLAKYRVLSGDAGFDDLLEERANPYVRFLLTGDESRLLRQVQDVAYALSVNWPGLTSEVRFTDRLYRFPLFYTPGFLSEEGFAGGGIVLKYGAVAMGEPDRHQVLYSMVTGDPGNADFFPLQAVHWETQPRDLAVLVESAHGDSFKARLFHFGEKERPMGIRLPLLLPGSYSWRLCGVNDETKTVAEGVLKTEKTHRILLQLPSRIEVRLEIKARLP